jgi:hypothetical protein
MTPEALLGSRRRLAGLVAAAFLVRLLAAWLGGAFTVPRGQWERGYEIGAVALALAEGRGFSDPFLVPTGPTAAVSPVVPFAWSLLMRALGPSSPEAWRAIVLLDVAISAVGVLAVHALGRRAGGPRVGAVAALALAAHPVAVLAAGKWVQGASLLGIAVSLVLACLVALEDVPAPVPPRAVAPLALAFGASLWVEPHLGLVLLAWTAVSLLRRRADLARVGLLAGALGVVMVSPWLVRNAVSFREPVFLRSWAGPELLLGAVAGPGDPTPIGFHPTRDPDELARLQRVGEAAYAREKLAEAARRVRPQPMRYAAACAWRYATFWVGRAAWWRGSERHPILPGGLAALRGAAFLVPAGIALLGLHSAWWRRRAACRVLLVALLTYPVVYALTHVEARYRLPLEPAVIVAASLIVLRSRDGEVGNRT